MLALLLQAPTPVPYSVSAWFFQRDLPPEWQWASLAIGIVALGVGMFTLPQVIWGRANLTISFVGPDEKDGSTGLRCLLKNQQPPRGAIPFVDRRTADATVSLWIYDARGKELANFLPHVVSVAGRDGPRIQIPPSPAFMPSFIVAYRSQDGTVLATDGDSEQVPLAHGAYRCEVLVAHEARSDHKAARFVVAEDSLYWIDRGP